jgi:hypothetical protein
MSGDGNFSSSPSNSFLHQSSIQNERNPSRNNIKKKKRKNMKNDILSTFHQMGAGGVKFISFSHELTNLSRPVA